MMVLLLGIVFSKKREVDGITPDDLVFRALYRSGHMGFTGISYTVMVNNIVRSKYIFVENNKIEILFSNYIFGLTFQGPYSV